MSGHGFGEYQKLHKEIKDQSLIYQEEKEQLFFNDAKHKIIEVPEAGDNETVFDYDADQLMEYFENRNKDEESFQRRTDFYFRNEDKAQSKVVSYRELESNRQLLVPLSERYSNRWSYKRSSKAGDAADYYAQMAKLITKYKDDDDMNISSELKYKHKEEIMKYRMKGMKKAAVVKGRGDKHEEFLEARAELSCYMLLKDQLTHYISAEEDPLTKKNLEEKLETLNEKIAKAYKNLKKVTPKAQEIWRETTDYKRRLHSCKQEYSKEYPGISQKSSELLFNLREIESNESTNEWPLQSVLKDHNNATINKAESENQTWNNNYQRAIEKGDEETQRAMEREAIEKFDKMHVPTSDEILDQGAHPYIMNNLREYYVLTQKALPYYENNKDNPVVKEYINEHPEFEDKLIYLKVLSNYISYRLGKHYNIEISHKKNEKINSSFRYNTRLNYRDTNDNYEKERLKSAFRAYTSSADRIQFQKDLQKNLEKNRKKLDPLENDPLNIIEEKETYYFNGNKVSLLNDEIKEALDPNEYASPEEQMQLFKNLGLKQKELDSIQSIVDASFKYKNDCQHAIPKSVFDAINKKAAGLDSRAFLTLLRPVEVNSNGLPKNEKARKNLKLNLIDCENVLKNTLEARKPFLNRAVRDCQKVMFTVEQLKDHDYIRAHKDEAIKFLGMSVNLLNLYNSHAAYYQNEAPDDVKTFMFYAINASGYYTYARFHIQHALFGKGIVPSYIGGTSSPIAYAPFYPKNDYKKTMKYNEIGSKMAPMQATAYGSLCNTCLKRGDDPKMMDPDSMSMYENNYQYTMDIGLIEEQFLYQHTFNPKEDNLVFDEKKQEDLMREFCDPLCRSSFKKPDYEKNNSLITEYQKSKYFNEKQRKNDIN